jgi:hypothetical protein
MNTEEDGWTQDIQEIRATDVLICHGEERRDDAIPAESV